MSALPITIFADFTCPFSYVTEAALRQCEAAGDVRVRFRAFELYPSPAPVVAPVEEVGWQEPVHALAEQLGLALGAPDFRPRTRKAHEALYFAQGHDLGAELRAAIFAAYWAEGQDIGRIDVLVDLASEVGLDAQDMRIALDIDAHRDAVLHDEDVARQLRIRNVPTLYLGSGPDARILVGLQSPAELKAAIASR